MVKKRPKETNFEILGQKKECLGRTKSWYELDWREVLEGEIDGTEEDQVEAHEDKEQESLEEPKPSSSCSSQEASSYPSTIIVTPE